MASEELLNGASSFTEAALRNGAQKVSNSVVGGNVIAILPNRAFPVDPFASLSARIAGVPVSARLQETYQFQSDATRHAVESGAPLTDHVIKQPVRIDLSFEVSNYDGTARSKMAFEQFVLRWESRVPLVLVTEHCILNSMVCVGLSADNSAPLWGKLAFRATFQQIQLITLQAVSYPKKRVKGTEKTSGPPVEKAVQAPVSSGKQQPRTSTLSKMFSSGSAK